MFWRALLCVLLIQSVSSHKGEDKKGKKTPNILFIMGDDVGFGDLQSYGHPTQEHGAIDDLADNGVRFMGVTVPESMCTPSRAALMTGRLPVRSGAYGSGPTAPRIFVPFSRGGLPREELTLPEALQKLGYTTGMVGKWHLGINNRTSSDGTHLPSQHGFDFVGYNLPLTNNYLCDPSRINDTYAATLCWMYRGDQNVQQPIDMSHLTSRMEEDALLFLETYQKEKEPWFFFMSMPQTHTAAFCNEKYCGKSKRGPYGDMINEMHGAVERVINQLKKNKKDYENTLILFASDHGPLQYGCANGGESAPFRGGKSSGWEGGLRVPLIASWPDKIKGGQISRAYLSTMDLFPTLIELAGGDDNFIKENLPAGGQIDGVSILPQLLGLSEEDSHETSFYFCGDRLFSMRYGEYKIHFYTKYFTNYGENIPIEYCFSWTIPFVLEMFSCYDPATVKTHETPLLFNIDKNVNEDVPLKWEDYPGLYDKVMNAKQEFLDNLVTAPSQTILQWDDKFTPCCQPEKGNCLCDQVVCEDESCENSSTP